MSIVTAVVGKSYTHHIVKFPLPFGFEAQKVYLHGLPRILHFLADQGFISSYAFSAETFEELDYSEQANKAGGETADTEEIGKYA